MTGFGATTRQQTKECTTRWKSFLRYCNLDMWVQRDSLLSTVQCRMFNKSTTAMINCLAGKEKMSGIYMADIQMNKICTPTYAQQ
jgi:hypothetical protein